MCRKLALLATVLAVAGGGAFAAAPAGAPAPSSSAGPAAPQPAAAPAPRKASAEQRAEADRLDPLARAAFWAREFDIDPRDAEAGVKLAKALRELGRYDEAAAAADQVLVTQPSDLDALLESARAKVAANRGFYAIDLAQRAEAVAPRDWRPVTLLAIALEQSDRADEALAAHQKALSLAPDNPAVLTNLGMFYAGHGDPARAEPLLRRAIALPEATAQERQDLALVLGLEGRLDEAQALARQDLPPEQVDNNMAYLRAADTPAAPTVAAGGAGEAHSWQDLSRAQ